MADGVAVIPGTTNGVALAVAVGVVVTVGEVVAVAAGRTVLVAAGVAVATWALMVKGFLLRTVTTGPPTELITIR